MKKIIMLLSILFISSCGNKKEKTDDATESGIQLKTVKDSKILKKLKGSEWELPTYKQAFITIHEDETITSAASENSVISNGNVSVLDEDRDIVVFNVFKDGQNHVHALQIKDNNTIRISLIGAENDIKGYKVELERLGVDMTKK